MMASSVGHQRCGDSKLLLFLSLLLAMAPVFDGRVVAVWSDMESIPGGAAPASPKGQPSSLPCCGGLNRTLGDRRTQKRAERRGDAASGGKARARAQEMYSGSSSGEGGPRSSRPPTFRRILRATRRCVRLVMRSRCSIISAL